MFFLYSLLPSLFLFIIIFIFYLNGYIYIYMLLNIFNLTQGVLLQKDLSYLGSYSLSWVFIGVSFAQVAMYLLVVFYSGDYTYEIFKHCRFMRIFKGVNSNDKFKFTTQHHYIFNSIIIMLFITFIICTLCLYYTNLLTFIEWNVSYIRFGSYFNTLYFCIIIFTSCTMGFIFYVTSEFSKIGNLLLYLSFFTSLFLLLISLCQALVIYLILLYWRDTYVFGFIDKLGLLPDFGFDNKSLLFAVKHATFDLSSIYCVATYLVPLLGFFLLLLFFLFACEDSVYTYSFIFSLIRTYVFTYEEQESLFISLQKYFPTIHFFINRPYFICSRNDFINFYITIAQLTFMFFFFSFYFNKSMYLNNLVYIHSIDPYIFPLILFPTSYFGVLFILFSVYGLFFFKQPSSKRKDLTGVPIKLNPFNWILFFILLLAVFFTLDLQIISFYYFLFNLDLLHTAQI